MMLKLLLLVFIVTLSSVCHAEGEDKKAEPYEIINNYLVSKVEKDPLDESQKDDPFALMNIVIQWHKKVSPRHPVLASLIGKKEFNQDVFEGLTNLVGLSNIIRDIKCNAESHKIRVANDKGIKYLSKAGRGSSLVYKIIQIYGRRHAKLCRREYVNNFERQLKLSQNTLLLNRLDYSLSDVVQVQARAIYPFDPRYRISREDFLSQLNDDYEARERAHRYFAVYHEPSILYPLVKPEVVMLGIKDLIKSDPDIEFIEANTVKGESEKGYVIPEQNIEQFYKKYVFEPCDYLMEQFGADIFEPHQYDATLLYWPDEDRVEALPGKNLGRFYLFAAEYALCQSIVNNEKVFVDELRKQIKPYALYRLGDDSHENDH